MGPKPEVQFSFWLCFIRVDQSFSNKTYFDNCFDQFGQAYKACVCYVFMFSFKSDSSQQC